jgi:streptogrisin C
MHDVRHNRYLPRTRRLALAIALGASALVPATLIAAPPPSGNDGASQIDKRMLQAMQRDLGLDARQAARYLEVERSATARLPEARRSLGTAYAGSWLEYGQDGRFRLVIATTDSASAERARGFGAEARVFKRSLAQLESVKRELDRNARQRKPNAGIHSWYIDVKTNQVVIEAEYKAREAALDFAAISEIDAAAVRFEESRGVPRTTQIVGGERYNLPGGWCSIGFPVTQGANTGFATAGHCGGVGTATTGTNGIAQGTFAGSNFPGADMGWVRITNPGAWPLRNWVTNYAGGTVPIVGSAVAPVGAAVCRSGGNTGYRCGAITATNVTVNYAQGAVFGLTSSSACVGFGDSGGSFITPAGQAQGVTSGGQFPFGGNDNCTSNPPVTFYQPLQPLLNQYGLTLFTGAPQNTPPTISSFVCPDYNNSGSRTYVCYVSYTSGSPASVSWTGGAGNVYDSAGYSELFGRCSAGQQLRVTVTISNAGGSVSRSSSFSCPTGPIP